MVSLKVILFTSAVKQKAKSAFPKNNRYLGPSEVYVHFPRIGIFYVKNYCFEIKNNFFAIFCKILCSTEGLS